jgi:OmpA-OmpF porin, OOP family
LGGLAQSKHAVSLRYNTYNYVTPRERVDERAMSDVWSRTNGWGLEAAYTYQISQRTGFTFPFKIGQAQIRRTSVDAGSKKTLANADALFQHHFLKISTIINPSIHFGLGSGWLITDDKVDLNIPLGLGLDIKISQNVFLTLRSQYRASNRSNSGWQHGLGFTQYLAKRAADRDADGIADATDPCPDVPGVASLLGCPDRDGDGISDQNDQCPDVVGSAALIGCPDRDGDGITDGKDQCPETKGLTAFNGCPDTDSDGIPDKDDKCPREAGSPSNGGCPGRDKDGDGVVDSEDACPNDKGSVATKGCPDTDGDGVTDREDACPDKKGDEKRKGCPDSDGDGLYDNEDRCPDRAGTLEKRGCPDLTKEDKEKIDRAIQLVQFESGKAILLASSFSVLDEIAAVMRNYPEYKLSIAGHTDNQGDDKMNLVLSERRAKTCYEYLVKKGIQADRITYAGFGEVRPVASNETIEGRNRNRRVTFDLYLQ